MAVLITADGNAIRNKGCTTNETMELQDKYASGS